MAFGLINKSASVLALACLAFALPELGGEAHAGRGASQSAAAEVLDVPRLLREGRANTERNWVEYDRRRAEYTFKWRRTLRKSDGKGGVKERSELMELYLPPRCRAGKCQPVSIKLEEDGRVVAPEKVERERLRAGRRLEKAEREAERDAAANAGKKMAVPYWLQFTYFTKGMIVKDRAVKLDGQEILEKCEFSSPRRERLGGREMIAFDFTPRPGAAFNSQSWFMPLVEGRIWLDAADKVFVRLAAWPKGTRFADATSDHLLENAALAYDTVRVKEGVWMFRLGRVNGLKYPGLFGDVADAFSIEISDYRRFTVEADKVDLKVVEKSEQ